MAQNKEWGDSIMLTLAASLWSIRITVVSSRTLSETKFRHDQHLEMVDLALIFNNNEEVGHYSGCIRSNKEVMAAAKLGYSRNYNKSRDLKERYRIGCPSAIPVAKLYKIEFHFVEKSNLEKLKSAFTAFTEIETIIKDAPSGQKERKRRRSSQSASQSQVVYKEKEIQEIAPGDTKCDKCKKDYETTTALQRHIDKYHKHVFVYNCPVCGKGLQTSRGLKEHKVSHGAKPFHCSVQGCTTCFTTKRAQKNHEKNIHKDKEQHMCQYGCGKAFTQKRYRRDHHKRCEKNDDRTPYKCQICGEAKWYIPGDWNRHMKEKHNFEATLQLSDDDNSDSE